MNPLSLLPPPPPSTNFFNDPHNHHYRGNLASSATNQAASTRSACTTTTRASPPPRNTLLSLFNPSSRREHATRGAFLLLFLRFYFSSVSSFLLFFLPNLDLSSNFPSLSPSRALLSREQKAISRVITASIATSVTRRTELHFACRPPPLLILLPLFVNTSSSSLFGCCNRYQRDVFIIVERSLVVELFQLDISRRHAEYEERSSPLFREKSEEPRCALY